MNDISMDCKIDRPYRVHLTFLPISVPKGTSFRVRIFGVQSSARYYNELSSVLVTLTNQADLTVMEEFGMV